MLQVSILLLILNKVFTEDVFYTINNSNVLHRLNDKFLSISIDPAVLLAGANLSDASLLLAKHLSPAYIRLAGPSTPFVKYLDNEEDLILRNSEEGNNVIITPSMWFGINEWFNLAGLTPVFGINDKETEKGVWDPKSTLPLLEMSDKFGVNCYWQLGYDCSNKTTLQYVENLNILKQTLYGFPGHNESWKVVGSDLSKCISDDLDVREFEKYVNDLDDNTNAIMWESALIPKSVLGFTKSAFWTSVPKDPKLVTFSSAMKWARQVGEAATMEYDVIFRQPRILEMTYDTPVYWFSLMHKKLMGNNVLQLLSTNSIEDLSTFVHCTKRQNNFVRTGAVTVMAINDGSETHIVNVNLGLMGTIMLDKSMEIQSYFLTASDENPSDVYLNNQKLTMSMLKKPDDILKPKLRRTKIRSLISLKIPAQTIGFFVLTGARNALCSKNEENLNTILAEINEDQEQPLKIEGRRLEVNKAEETNSDNLTFESIKKNIINEMEHDKNFYDKMINTHKSSNGSAAKENFKDKANRNKEKLHRHLKDYIEKAKLDDNINLGMKRQRQKISPSTTPSNNLYFTINEIEDILKRRAKAYAEAKNIKLTNSELNMLIDKATVRLPKHFIAKRDINKILLEEKANFHKNNMLSQEAYEQNANELKLQPNYNSQRSFLSLQRNPRNINRILLKSRAMLEEHKKYMLERNKHLQNGHLKKQPKKSSLSKRDINLDLLKTRTKPTAQSSGRKIAVHPSLKDYKQYLRIQKGNQAPKESSEEFSDEFLKDFLNSEEFTIEETHTPSRLLKNEEISDINILDFEELLDESKAKPSKFNFYSLSSKPKWEIFFPKKFLTKNKKKSDAFGEYSKLFGASSEVNDFEDDFQPCSHERGFLLDDSGEKKNNKLSFGHLLQLNSGKNKQDKFSVVNLDSDEPKLFQNMEYGFLRKKREINSTTKEKLKMVKNDISEAKALKKEIQKDKVKYKNKINLKQRQHFKNLKQKGLQQHIQVALKSMKNKNDQQQLLNAKSKRNTTNSLSHHIVKRYLINNNPNSLFGQYQPLTAGLRPWQPMDILGLQNDFYLKSLPLYNWMQTQNLRNSLLQNNFLGRRRRRYIETDSIENEIFSDELQRTNLNKIKIMKKEKYQPEAFLKEKQTTDKEIQSKGIKIQKVSYVKSGKLPAATKIATNEISEGVIDNMVHKEKLTYLERVLGKKKMEPLENFVAKGRKYISNMGRSLKNFFTHIF